MEGFLNRFAAVGFEMLPMAYAVGADNEAVYSGLLDVDSEELARLHEAGVV